MDLIGHWEINYLHRSIFLYKEISLQVWNVDARDMESHGSILLVKIKGYLF